MKGTKNEENNEENSPLKLENDIKLEKNNEISSLESNTKIDLKVEKLSKQARNRFYAQTSRARHRIYVANLEKEKEILLPRLTKLEEENLKMREELMELRYKENSSLNSSSSLTSYSNSSSHSHSHLQQNSFALSVLDFNRSSLGPNSLDSPLNERLLLAFASALLVSENGKRPSQMNWKSKFCCQQEEKMRMNLKMMLRMNLKKLIHLIRNSFHLKNSKTLQLRLINLLRTYLQQSIK